MLPSDYTKEERKGIVRAFKKAKKKIETREECFICHAIGSRSSHTDFLCYTQAEAKARTVIENRMRNVYGVKVLDSWLLNVVGIDVCSLEDRSTQMRLYRLRWLDHLIKEFSV